MRRIANMQLLVLFSAICCAAPAGAACQRYVPDPKQAPQFDGPGSFGKLQDTVTLECLSYAGSIGKGGVEQVLIRDDRGDLHRLRVGDYMGENSGVIRRIDDDAIYIEQLIREGGTTKAVTVRFPKATEAKAR